MVLTEISVKNLKAKTGSWNRKQASQLPQGGISWHFGLKFFHQFIKEPWKQHLI